MNEILSVMADHGLNPGSVELNAKLHKFKATPDDHKQSAWYIGFQNHTRSGDVFQVVLFGNYRDGLREQWQTDAKYSADDRKHIKAQMAKARKIEEDHRFKLQTETAAEVTEVWPKKLDEGTSGYLKRKKIDGQKLGIKYDGKGSFYVPMQDIDGKLWSWQKIYWDGTEWIKRFHTGGRVTGCFHTLGSLQSTGTIYVCEGFATAASVHLATSGTTVVAFNTGNLSAVCKELRRKFPDVSIVVAGDDDRFKDPEKNPGREAAEEAAKGCLGRTAFPVFKPSDSKPTDWNDLHCLEGLETVKAQLNAAPAAPKLAVYPLGFDGADVYFTSTKNQQISCLRAFTEKDMFMLAPLEYWEALFPGAGAARVDWSLAKSTLIAQAQTKGIFKLRHVRGSGVWNDEGRVVINMGDHLVVDGRRAGLGEIKSRYFYTLGSNLSVLHSNPLSVDECKTFIKTCAKFKWTKADSWMLLAGVLVTSRICGALPIRPHAWITGGAQTGKTTLLERLIKPVLGPNAIYRQGNSTEAGIRQDLKADAVPLLFDEFETTGPASVERIAAIIDLARASWADSSASIVKGGASGTASHFTVRFSGIFSSIRTKLINDADKGRFVELELAPHGSDPEHWRELEMMLLDIDQEFCERLFARTIKMLPTLLHNFKVMKRALTKRSNSRFGDQYGMLLAGYTILISDEPLDDESAEYIAEEVKLEDEKEQAKVADHDDAMRHLLTTKVQVDRHDFSIRELIALVWGMGKKKGVHEFLNSPDDAATTEYKKALNRLGIRVDLESVSVVCSNHAELEKVVWARTNWSRTWGNSLSRLTGAQKKKVRIGGIPSWAIVIPANILDLES